MRAPLLGLSILLASAASALAQTATDDERQAHERRAGAPIDTRTFAAFMRSADAFVIRAAEIARQRSKNREVRDLADRIERDHQASAKDLAAAAGHDAAGEMTAQQQKVVKDLLGTPPARFDEAYLHSQVEGHRQTIAFVRRFLQRPADETMTRFAEAVLPKLQDHEQAAEQAGTHLRGQ